MSVENLKEYARRCANEPELLAKAKAIGLSDMEGHMQNARSLDLDWTMDDLVAFRQEVIEAEGDTDDLGEDELEQVAGGVVTAVAAVVAAGVAGGVAGGAVVGAGVGAAAVTSGDGW